jgi:hypothetical protein
MWAGRVDGVNELADEVLDLRRGGGGLEQAGHVTEQDL